MATFDIQEILKLLPHRYPFLLVDRVIECDEQKRIVAIKNVTINEPFFQGHFPGVPVMPGVLQIEAMAQVGGILINRIAKAGERVPFFMSIDKAKFRRVVKPGDQLRIEIDITTLKPRVAKFSGKCLVEGEVASEADLMCMLTDQKVSA